MRLGTISICAAAFLIAVLTASAYSRGVTLALWSQQEELPTFVVQAMHGTVTSTSVSQTHNDDPLWVPSGSDPQNLFRIYDDDTWVAGPIEGCELDSVIYEMCTSYVFNKQAAQDELQQMMVDDPPLDPDTLRTYSLASVIEVDAEVWGYFGLTMGYSSTASQIGNTAYSWKNTIVESSEDCTADVDEVDSPLELIPRQYEHKQHTVYICHVYTYTPYLYQNTVTVSSGEGSGLTDRWWGVFVDPDSSQKVPVVTIGVNVNQ